MVRFVPLLDILTLPDTPNGNDNPRPDELTEAALRELEMHFETVSLQSQKLVRNQELDARSTILKALNVSTEIITDPQVARRLAVRHNAHVRVNDIARDMFDSYAGVGDVRVSASEQLALERRHANDHGVFVFQYDDASEEHRITSRYPDGSSEYVIAETSASHGKPGHMRYGAPRPVADAQFRLPEAREGAPPVFTIPDFNREPVPDARTCEPALPQELLERPQSVAQLEDIATDLDMGKMGLASHAIDRGLREIVEMINPQRGDHSIEYILAEIVTIRGMVLNGNHEILFNRDMEGSPILNGRSMVVFDHFVSDYVTHFEPAWTLQNRRVPVVGHSHVKALIVNWYVKWASTKR